MIRQCQICGGGFTAIASQVKKGGGKYCSLTCRDIGHDQRVKLECRVCGKPILKPPCKLKTGRGKYCSRTCKGIAQSQYQLGENGPNWRGGIYPANHGARRRKEYYAWRDAVYARDARTCQQCGATDMEVHAHHIFGFAEYPEHRLEIWNGTTLCESCHVKRHSKMVQCA